MTNSYKAQNLPYVQKRSHVCAPCLDACPCDPCASLYVCLCPPSCASH